MRFYLLLLVLFSSSLVIAQTFSGTGGSIPSLSTIRTCFNATVSGVGVIGATIGLSQVCLTLTHPYDDELEIVLVAPDGTIVPLTVQNGGSGNNYTNTCFSATASNSIKFGTAPFTGTFSPEGHLGAVNNGQNANGTWQLCIQDRRNGSNSGSLSNWSVTFSNTPAPAPPVLPGCNVTLPSTSSCATASLVCDFNGLCGTTNGTSVQDWPGSTLGACFGLQNNSFIKFIASASIASFSVWVPTSSTGGYNTAGIQMLFFSGNCGSGAVTTYGCYPHIFPSGNAATPTITVVSAAGLTPGNTYYLMIDGFNNDNCSFTIAANTGVSILSINPAAPSICAGQAVNLTATGGNGVYSWSPATNLNTSSGSTVTASPTSNTTYTVTSNNTGGCPITKDVLVTVNPLPTAPTLAVTSSCGSSTLTVTGATGTLTWSDGGTGNPRTVISAGTFSVTQTIGGCTSPASNSVTAAPTPVPASPVLTVTNSCGSSTLTVTGATGTLTWSDGGTGNPRTVTAPGNFSVTQTIGGCTSAPSNTVAAAPAATPATPVLSVVNSCGSSVLTVTGTSGTLTWSDGGTGNPRTVTSPGTFSVAQTIGGCTSPASNSVTAAPTPVPAAPVLTVTNSCGSSTLTVTGATGTLTWSDGGTGNPRTVTAPGNFSVTQTIGGCTSTPSNTVTAAPAATPVTPVLSVVNSCGSSVLTVTGTSGTLTWSDGGTGNPRTVTAAGNFTATQTINGCTSAASNSVTTAPTAAPPAPVLTVTKACGTATITASGFTGTLLWSDGGSTNPRTFTTATNVSATQTVAGCTSLPSATVSATPDLKPATPTFTVVQPSCISAIASVTVTGPAGFEYSLDGINYQASPNFTPLAQGSYSLTARNNSNSCVSDAVPISINAAPITPAAPTATVTASPTCNIPTGTISITVPLGTNFEYSVNGVTFQPSPIFSGLPSNSYDVVVRTVGTTCVSPATRLQIAPLNIALCGDEIYFPSAFTPNGDGQNDDFGPGPVSNLAGITAYSLEVFNRYGEKIFSTTDPYKRWNGRFKGKLLGNFSYVWQASYKNAAGTKKFKKGSVTMVL